MDAVVMPVGRDLYAVAIDWVREVVSAPALTPLVTAPAPVLGLFNLRGEVVPLLDTASLAGVGRTEAVAFAVVLYTPDGPLALSATGFPRRAILDEPLGPSELPLGAGVYRIGDRVAALLDMDRVLDFAKGSTAERHDTDQRAGALARPR